MDFKAIQAELLREKAEVMKSLGIDELSGRFDSAAGEAARSSRARGKAKAKAKVEAIDPTLLRRSTRCVGGGQRGAALVMLCL
jgi:hypothetical protein